MITILYLK